MKSSYCTAVLVKILLPFLIQLVVTSQAEGRLGSGQRSCPPGQVIHLEEGQVRCCLPVDCDLNHYVKFCEQNGTQDKCELCPRSYALFKRTSSFAYNFCQVFAVLPKECSPLPGNPKATEEDIKNCYCKLEKGVYFLKPQVPLGPTSFCQPFPASCRKGQQPTQEGSCEPCPKNTVQDVNDTFKLCRPQRNCSAMGVATVEMGSTEKETVCASPPSPPSVPSHHRTTTPVSLVNPTTKKKTTVVSNPVLPSAVPVLNSPSSTTFTVTHIVVLSISGFILLILIITGSIYARRKGWCGSRSACQRHHDLEGSRSYHTHHPHHHPGAPHPHSQHPQCHSGGGSSDNDNASDDSCCVCADSCLVSSSSKSGNNGRSGGNKPGACAPCKHPPGHVPMLEGYMNGKCGSGDLLHLDSEPLYNSISQDESKLTMMSNGGGGVKVGGGMYQNVNGVPPTTTTSTTMTKHGQQGGYYGNGYDYVYPSKVHLPSIEREEEDSLKKGGSDPSPATVKGKESAAVGAKDREDFSETDPLLPNLEVVPCNTHHHQLPLQGILRNGNTQQRGHQETTPTRTTRGGDGREVGGGRGGVGNRPNLSMLLSSVENGTAPIPTSSVAATATGAGTTNLPYLSQLVSSPHSVAGVGGGGPGQPKVQHQQLQQQAAPVLEPPQQHVHELPPQLQLLLQQQQHQQQEGSTLPLRLLPTTTGTTSTAPPPALSATSLVQMDELKPAMSLHPTPTSPTAPPPPPPPTTTTTTAANAAAPGATNVKERKGQVPRNDSPARINPSQQKEVRGGGGGGGKGRDEVSPPRGGRKKPVDGDSTKPEIKDRGKGEGAAEPGRQRLGGSRTLDDDETTLRKEAALPATALTSTRGDGKRGQERRERGGEAEEEEEEEEEETTRKSVGGSSGLGDSLDLSSPLSLPPAPPSSSSLSRSEEEGEGDDDDGRRSRSVYRRSNSEASRSVSPQQPLPPSRSISSPGDRNRPYAVVKPMQSDQSLDTLESDRLRELTRPLDSADLQYPLNSLRSSASPTRQSSQDSSDEHEETENA